MFDSFQLQSSNDGTRSPSMRRSRQKNSSSSSLSYACTECRRRKCRCDGAQPCQRCKDARKASLCTYVAPKQRVVPSQKAFDELWASNQQYQSILEKLFPAVGANKLTALSRPELLQLVSGTGSAVNESPSSGHTNTSNIQIAPISDASLTLDRRLRDEEPKAEFDEASADFVADDVNALSLSSKKYSSYLGSASVAAAFRVVAVLSPHVREFSSKARENSPIEVKPPAVEGDTSKEAELEYINAYFAYLHPIIPMLDEASFRTNYLSNTRTDSSWLALLNVVLAIGSIAALTSADNVHAVYYARAKEHLGLDVLGRGHIESVQALGLMGGKYLHYCQQPNMGFAVIGAAIRVATALGLHRQSDGVSCDDPVDQSNDYNAGQRTWWGLFCLDTWGSTTLGRPSFDWSGPSITIQPITWESSGKSLHQSLCPFAASIQFCKISAEIQDRLSYCSILNMDEMRIFDAKLTDWFRSLPSVLKSPNPCPKNLLTPRAILKWRYQNMRLLLYRPVLLFAAICQKSREDLSESDLDAIERCRVMASETIVDIASERVPDQISGWNATWFLFQASMVPLVSIFWEKDDVINTGRWQSQLDMVLQLLEHMTLWSPVARKCHEVLESINQINLQDRERRQGQYHNSLSLETQELEALRSTFPEQLVEQLWDSESWDRILEFGTETSTFLFDPMPIV